MDYEGIELTADIDHAMLETDRAESDVAVLEQIKNIISTSDEKLSTEASKIAKIAVESIRDRLGFPASGMNVSLENEDNEEDNKPGILSTIGDFISKIIRTVMRAVLWVVVKIVKFLNWITFNKIGFLKGLCDGYDGAVEAYKQQQANAEAFYQMLKTARENSDEAVIKAKEKLNFAEDLANGKIYDGICSVVEEAIDQSASNLKSGKNEAATIKVSEITSAPIANSETMDNTAIVNLPHTEAIKNSKEEVTHVAISIPPEIPKFLSVVNTMYGSASAVKIGLHLRTNERLLDYVISFANTFNGERCFNDFVIKLITRAKEEDGKTKDFNEYAKEFRTSHPDADVETINKFKEDTLDNIYGSLLNATMADYFSGIKELNSIGLSSSIFNNEKDILIPGTIQGGNNITGHIFSNYNGFCTDSNFRYASTHFDNKSFSNSSAKNELGNIYLICKKTILSVENKLDKTNEIKQAFNKFENGMNKLIQEMANSHASSGDISKPGDILTRFLKKYDISSLSKNAQAIVIKGSFSFLRLITSYSNLHLSILNGVLHDFETVKKLIDLEMKPKEQIAKVKFKSRHRNKTP